MPFIHTDPGKDYLKIIEGGITASKGFEAASHAAGIKYKGREDMALVYSEAPCKIAGTFTTNVVKAAPVLWDKERVEKKDEIHAVVINSGIANACTGEEGMRICKATAEAMAAEYGKTAESVLVASTGVIGMQIPVDKITAGCKELFAKKGTSLKHGTDAACAIMTTDTHKKEIAVSCTLQSGKVITVGGMCKGSGMIHPNMCTMLGFVGTDAKVEESTLQKVVSAVVQDTFNMISVDGDTSTNDTYMILANGMADAEEITEGSEDYERFYEALNFVSTYLARQMAGDGEGATALFTAHVVHAVNRYEARLLAKSVICSSLSKAAIFGHDANFGRFLCAMGYSGADFDQNKVVLTYQSAKGELCVFDHGVPLAYSEEEATEILKEPEVTVLIDMNDGEAEATAWGCDLSYDYVRINADYRS